MRHEALVPLREADSVDAAAVWPTSAQIAPAPIPEPAPQAAAFQPTPAADDVPALVGGLIAASYAFVILALFATTAGTGHSIFMIVIAGLFVVTFFTVPRIFFAVEPRNRTRASMERFMREGVQTLTGHSSGTATLVQMLIVPVLLGFGILAMGVVAGV